MRFHQIMHEDLGCASYLLADGGEAAVVDPKWEIDEYLRLASLGGATITHVLETHNHADHVSGRRRLQAVTGARLHMPADPERPAVGGLRHGEEIAVGALRLRALGTPGHRPEHLAYLVTDEQRAPGEPCLLLSGDSVLVGDLARPDLAVAARDGAGALWETVRRFESLPDHLELWPAHVGGSLCGGGSLSPKTSSTVGYERRANPLLRTADRDAFLDALTRCTPPRPPTVERVVALNRDGAAQPGPLPELDCSALGTLLRAGGTVLDARTPEAFDRGHFAGAVNLPASGRGLGTRAGWAVGAGRGPIAVIAESAAAALAVSERLYAAGVWDIAGVAAADPAAWAKAGLPVRTAGALTAERLVPALVSGEISLIDVRDADEWRAGHIAGSLHLPLHELGDGDGVELPTGAPLAVACASGGRAAIAASVLRRRGGAPVWRVAGGVADIARHGAVLAS